MGDDGISRLGLGAVAIDHRLSDEPAAYRLRGDDVTAVAFVPRDAELSHPALARPWRALAASTSVGPPPMSFGDAPAWLAWLHEPHHLGALALMAPTLELDEAGVPVGVQFHMLGPALGAGFFGREHNSPSPVDAQRHAVEGRGSSVRIQCWQRFALPNPLHPEGRFDADAPVPFGWIHVSYDLSAEGGCRAHLASSYLPAVWFYRDGLRVHRVDLAHRTEAEITAALCPSPDRPAGTTHRWIEAGRPYAQELRL